jgi:hypothetical protein
MKLYDETKFDLVLIPDYEFEERFLKELVEKK